MTTRADFLDYDRRNPAVWPMFERFALEAARAGVRMGAKAIWERMRWEVRINTPGDDFAKLNNSYVSWYSRRFKEQHPGYGQIFAIRKAQADREPEPPRFLTKGGQQYAF